jgi:Domain of unknown function (DU1801)
MSEPKTQMTDASVPDFLAAIEDDRCRADCEALVVMMSAATKAAPRMWGEKIVGFGTYRQMYANGKSLEWPLCGFATRKKELTLYILGGYEQQAGLLAVLGKHRRGKSCLYIRSLDCVHIPTLRKLIKLSVAETKRVSGQS